MVHVAIYGVGRLGQAIIAASKAEREQGSSDVQIVAGVDAHSTGEVSIPVYSELSQIKEDFDVLIDSSRAAGLQSVLDFALTTRKPLVIAATGHDEAQQNAIAAAALQIPIFMASNLSVGVHVLRELVENAGRLLGAVDAEIVEAHHRMKTDAPSGTALTLATALRNVTDPDRPFVYGRTPEDDQPRNGEIGIHAVRGGTVVGEHTVRFLLNDEVVELKHTAQSRQVFGFGALKAARFIVEQTPGLYGMSDMLSPN